MGKPDHVHTMLHETTKKFMEGFRYNAHPMAMLVAQWQRCPPSIPKPGRSTIHNACCRLSA